TCQSLAACAVSSCGNDLLRQRLDLKKQGVKYGRAKDAVQGGGVLRDAATQQADWKRTWGKWIVGEQSTRSPARVARKPSRPRPTARAKARRPLRQRLRPKPAGA